MWTRRFWKPVASAFVFLALGCSKTTRPGSSDDAGARASPLTITSMATWDLCRLIGPDSAIPGVYGTDLGFSFLHPQGQPGAPSTSAQVVLLFGDTMATDTSVCDYPPSRSDDLQGALPATLPGALGAGEPSVTAASLCSNLTLAPPAASGLSPRPIRLFPDASARQDANVLDTGPSRTPLAGFSDGKHAFGIFIRNDTQACDHTTDCSNGMSCSADPSYTGKAIGTCDPPLATSLDPATTYCRLTVGGKGDCGANRTCIPAPHGVCRADVPFALDSPAGPVSPASFEDNALRAIAQNLFIASAFWADNPQDYATGSRFLTNKFQNPAVRTVAYFDPNDPTRNDYRPGTHTLLMWGRSTFLGRPGFQASMFLLYQPLDGLMDDDGHIAWAPRYFAGYDDQGNPRWSPNEAAAQPLYGPIVALGDAGQPTIAWQDPEFDLVNQMTVSWVAPLGRWVMFYGGDLPLWLLYDPPTNMEVPPAVAQPVPGAIHMRSAAHPWGRSSRTAPAAEGWTAPVPVLTQAAAAPYLACPDQASALPGCTPEHDPHRPLQFLLTVDANPKISQSDWPRITQTCLDGDTTLQYQLSGDSSGHLYAADIVDAWTTDVTAAVHDLEPGGRAADIYWHVSTWNPYQVVMIKTELRAGPKP